ncbi:MAG TPA: bifunctional phosphopantothenoylcysteine decarboxylase/phosphopantothenate--cysteine ligase CoaBC [Dehalococcoidia bacterium]|nr:bifunctional phosphopantothenoylcysteine decarboxylase/phosphopantothenate--cysteine ligase CoaBC [Dehalococcoidia bacterium]
MTDADSPLDMAEEASRLTARALVDKRIVLGVSGSIAAYKAFEIARRLEDQGATVDVTLTPNADRFAPAYTFRNLVSGDVVVDMWATDMLPEMHVEMGHRADALVVAPASATTLSKLANGIGDNMLTLTALASVAPLAVAPAMDGQMFAHPAVQQNLEALRARGVLVAGPVRGKLASGREGLGRMIEPAEVAGATRAVLGRRVGDLRSKHVVVTAGGTREAIDPVRYVGNHSTGKMGVAIAEAARDRGAAVTLVTTQEPPPGLFGIVIRRVASAAEMKQAVDERAPGTDALIMAAAVADYRPKIVADQKLKKDGDSGMHLELEQTEDILAGVDGKLVRVGFAAETESLQANARKKLERKNLDFIVANDVSADDSGFGTETNRVTILSRDGGNEQLPLLHKYGVAQEILNRIADMLRG